jgi:hypothetical protein
MTTTNGSNPIIKIVSIHDLDQRGVLSFDLVHVLLAIEGAVREYEWIVSDIECIGEPIPAGIVLSFCQLVDYARGVQQTINGSICGFPNRNRVPLDLESIARIMDFPRSPARIAILAVDSTFFEVLSKDLIIIDELRKAFGDVRDQDPRNYFLGEEKRDSVN